MRPVLVPDPPAPANPSVEEPAMEPDRRLPFGWDFLDALHDRGRAALLAKTYQGEFYWVEDQKQWYVWVESEGRWKVGRRYMEQLASSFLDLLGYEIIQSGKGGDLMSGSQGLGQRRTKLSMMEEAKSIEGVGVESSKFDSDSFLLGVRNGVVDLCTGKLLEPRKEHLVSLYTDAPYDPSKIYPAGDWDYLLRSSIPDPSMRLYLQQWFGSALTGTNHRESFLICVGLGGTGKSTLVNTIADALGPYATATNPDTFSRQKPGTIREDIADFDRRRLVHNMELPSGSQLCPTTIKSLTGGDTLRARKLHENGRLIKPSWSCVVGCNALPELSERPDSGWWRRVITVPFFTLPATPDFQLKDRLRHQHEQVLAWLIRGSRRYYRDCVINPHFVHRLPRQMEEEAARYRMQYDHVGYWADTRLKRSPGAVTDTLDITSSYIEFCAAHDIDQEKRVDKRWIGRMLASMGYKLRRSKERRYRLNVELVTPEELTKREAKDDYIVSLTQFEHEVDDD